MTSVLAEDILRTFDQMVAVRSNHEQVWQQIARVLRPLRENIRRTVVTPGQRRHQEVYHSGPLHALDNFKAGLHGRLTSPAMDWFEVRVAGDEDLNARPAVKEWLKQTTRLLRLTFTPAMSSFYNQTPTMYADLGGFGTGIMFTQMKPGEGKFFDKTISLEEAYLAANQWDEVDCVARQYRMSARAAVQRFGDAVSEEIKRANEKTPLAEFTFIHMTRPNPEFKEGSIGPNGFEFQSVYLERDKKNVVLQEGFRELPYHCPRWEVAAGEVYGRGQGERALADVLSLNAIRRDNMTMANRQSNPVLLATDEQAVSRGVKAYPGSVVYGGMSAEGRKLVAALDEGKNLNLAVEYENLINDAVKDAFFFGLMQIQGSADMTATEFMGRQEEAMRNLSPHVGRIEDEFLTPLIARRYRLLQDVFEMPEPPEEVAGSPLEIQYVSPLQRIQQADRATSAMRQLEAMVMAGQADPSVLDRFDGDAYAEAIEEGFGAGLLLSREEAEERRAARQQQQQMMMMMENAPGLAGAAKDMKEVAAGA